MDNEKNTVEKGNAGWAVLGFFIPLIGLILWLVWKNDRPGDAHQAGKGALIGVIAQVVLWIVVFLFYGSLLGSILGSAGLY